MVDNCYGEFVEKMEPSDVGADMIVGSLIKTPAADWLPLVAILPVKRVCGKCCIPSDIPGTR